MANAKGHIKLTGDTHLPEMLRLGRCRLDVSIRTLMMVDRAAMVSELANAASRSLSSNTLAYQSNVKPVQTMLRRLSLKLKATNAASGKYNSTITIPTHSRSALLRA